MCGAVSSQITVSSGGMLTQKLNLDDLQFEKGTFDGTIVYAQNKVTATVAWQHSHLEGLYHVSNFCCAICVFFVLTETAGESD